MFSTFKTAEVLPAN